MTASRSAGRLAAALDVPDLDEARRLATALGRDVGVLKVGLELFVRHGPAAVDAAAAGGARDFLDLKLHDIPRTAAAAVTSAGALGAHLVTLHALGGPAMMRAAREAAEALGAGRPRLLAVTVLTSHDAEELRALGLDELPEDAVERLARMALAAGAEGLVASAREAARLRALTGPETLLVTPGIRPSGADAGDQKRVTTPADAIRAGADLLVVGRPIVRASDPAAAARRIAREVDEALGERGS
jgi:orotidine-5'-phosphate decarboxylase